MAEVEYKLIKKSTLTSIADAIREKTGTTDAIKVDAIATTISGISVGDTTQLNIDRQKYIDAMNGDYFSNDYYTRWENFCQKFYIKILGE